MKKKFSILYVFIKFPTTASLVKKEETIRGGIKEAYGQFSILYEYFSECLVVDDQSYG